MLKNQLNCPPGSIIKYFAFFPLMMAINYEILVYFDPNLALSKLKKRHVGVSYSV